MDLALLLARLLLAAVFLVAGVAKLADRAGSRQALINFGVPAALATPGGVLLPLAELAVAVMLLPVATAWWGALGALALLLLFVAGIGLNLARGRTPDCHCFGQLHSAPAGRGTLIRNGLLAVVAAFVLWQGWTNPGPSLVSWLGGLTMDQALLLGGGSLILGLLAGMAWLLVHLLMQHGRLLLRIEALEARLETDGVAPAPAEAVAPEPGLPVGSPAPAFTLTGLHGETLTLDFLRAAGQPILLVFTDPNCGPCNALLPELGRWQREQAGRLTVALISRGTPEANRAKSSEHGLTHVLLQQGREVDEAYQVAGTPSAVIVRPDGTIGSPPAAGAEGIKVLVMRTAGLPAPAAPAPTPPPLPVLPSNAAPNGNGNGAVAAVPASSQVGDPAPPVRLPDLTGRQRDLAEFRGRKTLVLFWNPGCGFCTQMLDDLKAWEADPPADAPHLVVVSTGTVEANQALGLRAPVLLDQGFATGSAFGANGTPMAVLLDEQGRIAAPVAAGAPAVLALAGAQPRPAGTGSNGHGNGAAAPTVPRVGDPAPAVKLPDLGGKTVELSKLRGSKALLLFWNPGCGFCQRMLDDLKAWEAKPPKGAPRLVVVSTGTAEANRVMELRAPVLLDQGFATGSAFGATGTPSAVLIDERGKVASPVAVGAPAVLTLAGAGQEQAQPAGF